MCRKEVSAGEREKGIWKRNALKGESSRNSRVLGEESQHIGCLESGEGGLDNGCPERECLET